ncbi:MAG TPA: hypothetical protein VIM89_20940 [Mucilaginibacter sp.]
MRSIILTLFSFIIFPILGNAQIKIQLNDIKKINLSELEDGVAGFRFSRDYEIIRKKNKWFCYQVDQDYQPPHYIKRDRHIKEFKVQRSLIKQVNIQTIDSLLNSVSKLKSDYSWKMYRVDLELLKKGMSSYYRFWKEYPLKPSKRKIILALYKNPTSLKAAVDSVQHISPVDAITECSIDIIKKNNDTVKIHTSHMRPFMQPWQVNGQKTYDLNINHFFVAVMTTNSISNKDFLMGEEFYNDIINEIEIQYMDQHPRTP